MDGILVLLRVYGPGCTEDGIDEIIGQEQIYYGNSGRIMRP